jgi:hypothetical protein
MGGGLINIVSYGLDDLYLTGAAQVTFFKSSYRRHTNYSQESIEIDIGQTNFDEEIDIQFPKIGDLIGNTYLQVTLPQVSLLKTDVVADPSASEIAFLQGPVNLPKEYNILQTISDAYENIIKPFMATNMDGYREAKLNLNIKNQTLTSYIETIQSKLGFPPTSASSSSTLQTDYRNALEAARLYENSLGNHQYDVYLNYITSDISYLLTNISYDPSSYTIQDVANTVFTATNISVKVMDYFFQKKKQFTKILALYDANTGNSKYASFAWTDKIGHALIERVDVYIGGDRIDRHYFDYIEIWHELTGFNSQNILYNKTIGNVVELKTFDRNPKPSYVLNIPLTFWFCKKAGLYFPIIALQYSPISLTIKFNSINLCAHVEKMPTSDNTGAPIELTQLALSDIWDNKGYFLTAKLVTDYIYLDTQERKRFAQSAHEYLIETTQRMTLTDITDHYSTALLEFSGPVKEIIWYAQKTAYVQGIETQKKMLFNYTTGPKYNGNPFYSAELTLNGKTLFDSSITTFFSCVLPYARHTRVPADGINVYPFCLWPEEYQPSGSCNMSVIPNCVISFTIDPSMFSYKLSDISPYITVDSEGDAIKDTPINITIISKKMEILRVVGGMGGFAFKYMS